MTDRDLRRRLTAELKRKWQESGLTQMELGELAGRTQPNISDLFRGRYKSPNWDLLADVAAALGYDIELSAKLVRQP